MIPNRAFRKGGQTAERTPGTETSEQSPDARRQRLREFRTALDVRYRDRRVFYHVRWGVIAFTVGPMVFMLVDQLYAQPENRLSIPSTVAVIAMVLCLAAIPVVTYRWLGRSAERCIQAGLDTGEPAAAACVARALKRASMPWGAPYSQQLEDLTARIGRTEWELMTREDVDGIIAYAADPHEEWATRIGLVAVRSAAEHGEVRAIFALGMALRTMKQSFFGSQQLIAELDELLNNLKTQGLQLQPTNTLLRPADGSPQLLRAAADSLTSPDNSLLMRPVGDCDLGRQAETEPQ